MEVLVVTRNPGPWALWLSPTCTLTPWPGCLMETLLGAWQGGWLMLSAAYSTRASGLLATQGSAVPQLKAHFLNYMLGPHWGQPGGSCRPSCCFQRQFLASGPQETRAPPGSPAAVVLSTYAALCGVGTSVPHEVPRPGPQHRLGLLSPGLFP